ncbi:MAG: aspartate carbamoyltransferase regulatory subunit [Bacteroidales bacterium]|nr:aspartate carbamoyltransferase regulatory subunit [Bacteroidales bacterium]MCF8327051.1 aspartate carbamoyltransferase regulatory subunit [Bacteroidales bacterium]
MERKELKVSAIKNGTVIDHLPSDSVFQVIRILNLNNSENPLYSGINLESKKFGNKGIIKVENRYFKPEEVNKIALLAPKATMIEIKDFDVVRKTSLEIPDVITKVVKCINPKCITNNQNVPTKFEVMNKDKEEELKLHCHFCEKTTARENIMFK